MSGAAILNEVASPVGRGGTIELLDHRPSWGAGRRNATTLWLEPLSLEEREERYDVVAATSFATAAFWRMLAHKRMPFAYLGAIYLFEGLTPLVTGAIKGHLERHGFRDTSLEYIEFHSTEDIRHAKVIDAMIRSVVERYPQRADEVKFGFDAFRQVYPLPGWRAAVARARAGKAAQVA